MARKTISHCFILALAMIVTTTQALSYSAQAAIGDPCAVVLKDAPQDISTGLAPAKDKAAKAPRPLPPGTEVQYHHAQPVRDDLIWRDYLAENNLPDPDTGLVPPKLSQAERRSAVQTLLTMFANSSRRLVDKDVEKNKNIYLSVDLGDALDAGANTWTSPQVINLEYSMDDSKLNYILADPAITDRSNQNAGKGLSLAKNPLYADASGFDVEFYWTTYINRTAVLPRHIRTEVGTAEQHPELGGIEHQVRIPTIISQPLAFEFRKQAAILAGTSHDLLRHYASQTTSLPMRRVYRLMAEGHSALLKLPQSLPLTIVKKIVGTVAFAFIVSAITLAGSGNATPGDFLGSLTQQMQHYSLAGHQNTKPPAKAKSAVETFVSPDDQASMTQLIDSQEASAIFKIATPKAGASHLKAHDINRLFYDEEASLDADLGQQSTKEYFQVVKQPDGNFITVSVQVMPEAHKILVSKRSVQGALTSYFLVSEKDAPLTYAKLVKAANTLETQAGAGK